MKEYISDMLTTIAYALTFIAPPLIVGTFFGRTAERLAFCVALGYLAWKWADLYLQLEHANELAKKYLEEKGRNHEND